MERGKVYLDDDGDEIIYNWDGTITISRDGIVPKGGNFKDFEEFKKEQDKADINYLDSLEYYEELPPVEADVPSRILTNSEAVCVAEECSKANTVLPRHDQHSSVAHIHENVTYTFLDWESTTPTKQAVNEQWLRDKQEKMVCILSVSLAKPDSSSNRIDDTRRTMLVNAIYAWQKHGWAVLLFIPSQNKGQYEHCARIKTMFGNDSVNIVPYSIEQGTCNVNMNVGESRNAILHFLKAWSHIITVCTMADERVESVLRPLPVLSNAPYSSKDENIQSKEQRIKEGYDRLSVVNTFLRTGTDSREVFREEQRKSDSFWSSQSPRDTKFCRSVCALYDKSIITNSNGEQKFTSKTSIFHQLKKEPPTLVCFPQSYRWFMQKCNWEDLPKPRRRYKHWGKSASGKFCGGDMAPFGPNRLTMPTQLITFKVGAGGWDGQFYYPFTTIGEDNFFSYQWSVHIGIARQLNAVQIIRRFPRAAVSITRRPDDITTYTPCAIKELMFIINSNTYYQRNPTTMPTIHWTIDSDNSSPLSMPCYKWQAFIFCQIPAEVDRRAKLSATDRVVRNGMVVSTKVRHVCDKLLTFILSDKFREPKYFKEHTNQTYNNMIAVLKKNQTKYVEDLGLQFPENKP